MSGLGGLTRLALRLDRVRLTVWVLVIGLLPAVTAAQYRSLYPTTASLDEISGVISNRSLVAITGPLFAARSIGALTAWKVLVTELILVALMAMMTVVRHSRAEEESGRLELLGAGVVGRLAPLGAALLTATVAAVASGVITALGLAGARQPVAGSVAMGAAIALTGIAFAAVGGVAAQLTASARTATGIGVAVVGASYLLRAFGDTGPVAASWVSPLGWAMRVRPFAGERWWVLLIPIALAAVLAPVALAIAGRRDLGFGLIAPRPGPAGSTRLRSAFALAWRLQRGVLLAWLVGMAVWGAVLGGSANAIATAKITDTNMTDILTRLGGSGTLGNAYLGAVFGITGLVVAAYAVQTTLRLRTEESSGRLEAVLATRTGRLRWMASHLAFAVVGPVVLLAVSGVMAGLAYGAAIHDVGGQVGRLTAAALVQAPAAWVLTGIGAALFGLVPQLTSLAWAALVACLVILEVGEILGLSHWLLDVSPFAHVPKLPGGHASGVPLLWLTLIAAVLTAVGGVAFRRRNLD